MPPDPALGTAWPRLAPLFWVGAAGTAFLRVYRRDHTPSEVAAGALVGAAMAALARRLGAATARAMDGRSRAGDHPPRRTR